MSFFVTISEEEKRLLFRITSRGFDPYTSYVWPDEVQESIENSLESLSNDLLNEVNPTVISKVKNTEHYNMEAINQRLIDYMKENETLNIKIIELEKELQLSEGRFTFVLYAVFSIALLFFGFFLFTFI